MPLQQALGVWCETTVTHIFEEEEGATNSMAASTLLTVRFIQRLEQPWVFFCISLLLSLVC